MKKLTVILFLIAFAFNIKAQGFFNQKGAQIKNLIKQIALLEVYIRDLEKGYDIAKKGLNTISDIKNGDLHLHLDNFNGLKIVNPKIKGYVKLGNIITLQLEMLQVRKSTANQIKANGLFSEDEISYVGNVFTKLLDACADNIAEIISLTSSGDFEMKDDERLKRIDVLYLDMQDKYSFTKDFSKGIQVLAIQRMKEKDEVQTSRLLNNIKIP